METRIITEKPTAPAYPGARWIYHRLTIPREYMFDARTHTFAPGEYKQMAEREAIWLYEHHIAREHPSRQDDPDPAVRAETLEYAFALDDDPHFGVPLVLPEHYEYLSRAGGDYLQRGMDVPTTAKIIKVGEVPEAPLEEQQEPPKPANGTTSVTQEQLLAAAMPLAQQMARQMMDEVLKAQRPLTGRRPRHRRGRPERPAPSPPGEATAPDAA